MIGDKILFLLYLYKKFEFIYEDNMITETYSKEEAKDLKMGIYAALIIILISCVYVINKETLSHKSEGNYYTVDARFNRTDGLLVGDDVRMAGVSIGRVVNAKLDEHFKAILTLDIKESVQIPDDSSASIVSSSIMGKKYIEIEPGGSMDYIPRGGEFSYTQDAMVLEELLDRIISIGKSNRSKNVENK